MLGILPGTCAVQRCEVLNPVEWFRQLPTHQPAQVMLYGWGGNWSKTPCSEWLLPSLRTRESVQLVLSRLWIQPKGESQLDGDNLSRRRHGIGGGHAVTGPGSGWMETESGRLNAQWTPAWCRASLKFEKRRGLWAVSRFPRLIVETTLLQCQRPVPGGSVSQPP